MNETSVIKREEMGVDRPIDIESLFRYAMDKGGVETVERLMVVRRELNAEKAKAAFDVAMADFQNECPVIVKAKAGAKGAYKYAPLDAIIAQVRELIRKNGFSFSITSEIEPGWCKAVCLITHSAGHSRASEFKVPVDNKNPMMTDPQRYGGAMTFSKRYAFCNAFGILTADEDLDGGDRPKPKGPSSLHGEVMPSQSDKLNKQKLVDLTRSVHMIKGYGLDENGKRALEQFLIDENYISDSETLGDLAGDRLAAVVVKLEAKLKGNR